jgi:glycosyltransferase involved in cell wall biosynthesis
MLDEQPNRVLICTQGFPRSRADHHAPFLLDHARALAEGGADVTVLCPSGPGLLAREEIAGVRVVRFRYAPRRLETLAYSGAMHRQARGWRLALVPALLAGFLVAALREGRNADVLHAHWWVPSGAVAVLAGWLLGLPTVVHLHGTDAAITGRLLRPAARRVLRGAGDVLAAGPELARWCLDLSGVEATVAPMPLAVDRLPPLTPAPADGTVLGVGRLVPEKGFDVLVRAGARSGLAIVLVGDGDQRSRLESLAWEVGADVTFVGAVAPAELAAHYAAARIVAVPSRREGFGMVAAEALGSGRAVVASDVGGLPELVEDGVNGALVPPGDVDALAAALRSTDPALGAAGPASVAWLLPASVGESNRRAHARALQRRPEAHGQRVLRAALWLAALGAVAAFSRREPPASSPDRVVASGSHDAGSTAGDRHS